MLAAVCDLGEFRDPVSAEGVGQFETDALAGFVLVTTSGVVGRIQRAVGAGRATVSRSSAAAWAMS